ncbi:metallo-beta-lactamase superfamily protein [bacterium BMS3Abin11]|nr:metallo-beta-lactamase superfamily protein [bacterium BMS3Abin11]
MKISSSIAIGMCTVLAFITSIAVANSSTSTHFDSKGKLPSKYTIEYQKNLRLSLPFEDRQDFEEMKKGFIAAPKYRKIMADAGNVAWDMGKYDFLLKKGQNYDSINPSLQRQAILNMNYGLYEVMDGVYQIRGFDLANITFIKGKTGWIIFDPLTAKETARAALKFINEQLGERPVVAVVYSHSHGDHFGGVRGVVDEKDVKSGKVKVIAPVGFMQHAVAENVYAGTAMARRMFYQYGVLLPASPYGHVDQAIGKSTAVGNLGLIPPNVVIKKDFETMTVDGIKMVFQNTPGTEAPAEMNTFFPDKKLFWAAENIVATVHNIYTLRGALVRDALEWSKEINAAIYKFGPDIDAMIASHSWPRWGNDRVLEVMKDQRDIYANLNNGVMHLANEGVTINQIHNVYKVPESLQNKWHVRSYHGSVSHNSRAVINRYLGYWDGNPTTLIPLSPEDSAPFYVEMMGGSKKIISKGQALYDQGKYRLATEILNKLVYAQPDNQKAKDLLADSFEQIGYQRESASVRNSFLAAAYELRHGISKGAIPHGTGPDMVRAMGTGLWLDYLAIRLDGSKVEGLAGKINLITPDNKEKYAIELSNETLNSIEGYSARDAGLTITINREDLLAIMMGLKTFDEQLKAGKAQFKGDRKIFDQIRLAMTDFNPFFELMPGTAEKKATTRKTKPLQVETGTVSPNID